MPLALHTFLLALPALVSIVNPLSSAFIFRTVTASFTHDERLLLTRRVATYSFFVLIVSLIGGSYLLEFFGVSVGALRVAGGSVVAAQAWALLSAPEQREEKKQEQAEPRGGRADQVAFFPLTMPFTTGPGTISVAVSLGTQHPSAGRALVGFYAGLAGAAVVMAALIWLVFGAAERVGDRIGPAASRTITRVFAFLLLCIGVQILIHGIEDVVRGLERG